MRPSAARSSPPFLTQSGIDIGTRSLQRWNQTKHNAGQKRHSKSENQHEAVGSKLADPRQALSGQRYESLRRPSAKRHAENASGASHQDAFREQLPDQIGSRRAERDTDSDFFLARQRPREQQAGNVGAGDPEQQHNRAKENQNRGPDIVYELFVQAANNDRVRRTRIGERGILVLELAIEHVHLSLRPIHRDARTEARHGIQKSCAGLDLLWRCEIQIEDARRPDVERPLRAIRSESPPGQRQ